MRFASCIFTFICAVSAIHGYHGGRHDKSPLFTEYKWKYFDYVWDAQHQKNDYIKKGLYDYRNMTPIDVDRSTDGRTFVTIIRTNGVPATLHTISNIRGESGPLLNPYPDWSWYESLQCDKIINVYRVAIDECNRMWVLDTGVIDNEYPCSAKLLVFDLKKDRLLFTHVIPDDVARNKSGSGLLITPVVETGPYCKNPTVYMADVFGHGLVIYNNGRSYRLEADEFEPEGKNSNFTIAGESFYLDDGLFGLALSPLSHNPHKRFLAFRSLASKSLYLASTEVLKRSTNGRSIEYSRGIDVLPSQASAMAFSSEGTLFYGLTSETAIGCWNAHKPLEAKYFKMAIQDYVRLQFTSGLKVIKNSFREKNDDYLLMMTNRLQKIYDGTMDFNEINFRISSALIRAVINGTICSKY